MVTLHHYCGYKRLFQNCNSSNCLQTLACKLPLTFQTILCKHRGWLCGKISADQQSLKYQPNPSMIADAKLKVT